MTAGETPLGLQPHLGDVRPGELIQIVVPGQPVGKARARTVRNRFTGKPQTFTPAKTAGFENLVKLIFANAYPGFTPIAGPVELRVEAYFQAPKYLLKKHRTEAELEQVPHTTKPDLSNVLKAVEDALNKAAYADDAQVSDYAPSRSRYSLRPRTIIEIRKLEPAAGPAGRE